MNYLSATKRSELLMPRWLSKASCRGKQVGLKRLHEPSYITFWKRQNHGVENPLVRARFGGGDGVTTRGHRDVLGVTEVFCVLITVFLHFSKLLDLYTKNSWWFTMVKLYLKGRKKQMSKHSMC